MKLFIIVLVLAIEAIVAPRPREPLKQMKILQDGPGGKMVDAEPPLNRYIKQKKHRTARQKTYQDVQVPPSAPVSYRLGDLNVEVDMKAPGPRTARQAPPPAPAPAPVVYDYLLGILANGQYFGQQPASSRQQAVGRDTGH